MIADISNDSGCEFDALEEQNISGPLGFPKRIEVNSEEHRVTAEALKALGNDPMLYYRGPEIVEVAEDATTGERVPKIIPFSKSAIRDRLSKLCWFYRLVTKGDDTREEHVSPPSSTVNTIADRRHYHGVLRPLRGVVTSPFIGPDGEIVTEPGYDKRTGYLYWPIEEFPTIKNNPTLADALEARDLLLGVIKDFPFASEEDRGAWLAYLLTLVGRPMFSGPAPMFLIDANVRGSGKGLLADVGSIIAFGRSIGVTPIPENDAEFRKRITATAKEGDPVVLLDNADRALGCASLDAVLTSDVWKDRVLGRSEQIELPIKTVWVATGNNLQVKGDLSRRVVQCRLNSECERPEERSDFRFPDLRQYVRENRPELYVAALTILRAWFMTTERLEGGLKPWGSFEAWTEIIRGAIVFVGLPDPIETRKRLMETSDPETDAYAALLGSWSEVVAYHHSGGHTGVASVTASELLDMCNDHRSRFPSMIHALESLTGSNIDDVNAKSLGRRLIHYNGRVIGGKRLANAGGGGGIKKWFVQEVGR